MSPNAAPARTRHATMRRLTVAGIDRLTDDSVALTFAVPDELKEAFAFTQGQHVALSSPACGDSLRRSYSICTPVSAGLLRVAVKQLDGGAFSGYVHRELSPGDELDVMTPSGRFYTQLRPDQRKHYVAIVAGSGITPILSILATTLEVEPESTFTLLYGNRTTASIMFLEELLDLKNRFIERLAVYNVLSRERQEIELLNGRIDRAKLSQFFSSVICPEDADEWFLCGPMSMIDALHATLIENGVEPRRIHRELFHSEARVVPKSKRAAVRDTSVSTVTVILDGRASSFELSRSGEPILEAALCVRPDAPFACKGGVCGTCRALVTEGAVEMDLGYALEADELEAGFVLACQSHPRSVTVTLDFDR